MNPLLFLVGCGGHGRVVLDVALQMGLEITGIVDPGLAVGGRVFGVPVVGGDDVLQQPEVSEAGWLNGIGANPSLARRSVMFGQLGSSRAIAIVHPSAVIGRECTHGPGAQIMAGCIVQPGTRIGANAVVNTGARIDHDCWIGPHSFVGPGAILCGDVELGEGVFVGAGAVLLPGVRVGAGAIVAAGALVNRSVPPQVLVKGSPARKSRSIEL